jgi:hypothetical protein
MLKRTWIVSMAKSRTGGVWLENSTQP